MAARLSIDTENVVAFGDELNDLEMLSHCGIGVAMGNAPAAVKAAASAVCDMNGRDGAARWLETFLLR